MVFEEASTRISDEVSRPVVPASPMRAALLLSLKSGVGEARAARIELATPIPARGTEFAKETVEPWAGLDDNRVKDESKRD